MNTVPTGFSADPPPGPAIPVTPSPRVDPLMIVGLFRGDEQLCLDLLERPGDVIVLLSGHQSPVFEYYYRGTNRIAPMPEGIMPPAQSPLDYRAAQQLENIARGSSRLWLILWQRELADPTDVVMNELMTQSQRLGVED